ncbi:hypothetical protein PPL_05039 [Heterostelium album PN500]|uniref:Uncharacterized protein n=1 Tax=Heterostelium pallidum (strain ATCC 26659 / Pp 5 / PN500) TaxID=670386 RepID=D3B995_HETP5|nr:hypothetical protein PPL_05039 [Heterostelium album PN500]EFA82134.1 hypothetical protein PPL_05039 [Heterostelium album PN500]|eukprot:XP_020434251.1 hypothetical protein PPL_05039 [Heterostelium album PN500]
MFIILPHILINYLSNIDQICLTLVCQYLDLKDSDFEGIDTIGLSWNVSTLSDIRGIDRVKNLEIYSTNMIDFVFPNNLTRLTINFSLSLEPEYDMKKNIMLPQQLEYLSIGSCYAIEKGFLPSCLKCLILGFSLTDNKRIERGALPASLRKLSIQTYTGPVHLGFKLLPKSVRSLHLPIDKFHFNPSLLPSIPESVIDINVSYHDSKNYLRIRRLDNNKFMFLTESNQGSILSKSTNIFELHKIKYGKALGILIGRIFN